MMEQDATFEPTKMIIFVSFVMLLSLKNLFAEDVVDKKQLHGSISSSAELGPRPLYLINAMKESDLKKQLKSCAKGPFEKSDFSIGHRGAPLKFPEHTKESYIAAARMGAGIIECDVTFTKDKELVCRHSQCDLHTTTNILNTPLASKCSQAFQAAKFDADGTIIKPATAKCCTSDLILTEFKSLRGRVDVANPASTTIAEYLDVTPSFPTDLYTGNATLLTHAESIALFKSLNVKMIPELKAASVTMPFNGFSQTDYAQKMIDEYKHEKVKANNVFVQSFNIGDIIYWLEKEPQFGKQAVYLDSDVLRDSGYQKAISALADIAQKGVNIIAPPMWALVTLDEAQNIVPSEYALTAKKLNLEIITWTLERSGKLETGGDWYYQSVTDAINNDGDTMQMLHVLANDVEVKGVFSDWPATTTYYANCMGL